MKTNATLLAACLLASGLVQAQTETNTSSTTTTSTYTTAPVSTTDATNVNATSTTTPTNVNDNMTGTYNNTATTPAVNTYSTTTTTTSDYNTGRDYKDNKRNDGKEGKFGIYAGVNASRFKNESAPDRAYRLGYQVGLYGRSAGTVFGQIGAEFRRSSSNLIQTQAGSGTTPSRVSGQIDQTFLAIPAYVGLRVGGALGLRVQAGAELAALVAVGDNNFKLGKDDLNRTILNGLLGVGINLGPLTLDVNYNLGLQNVVDQGADTKRNMLAANIGFRF
ncbi:hypothetical protein GCM10027578_18810 [Spirosoma luteolum]